MPSLKQSLAASAAISVHVVESVQLGTERSPLHTHMRNTWGVQLPFDKPFLFSRHSPNTWLRHTAPGNTRPGSLTTSVPVLRPVSYDGPSPQNTKHLYKIILSN